MEQNTSKIKSCLDKDELVFILSWIPTIIFMWYFHGYLSGIYYISYESYRMNNDWIKLLSTFLSMIVFGMSYGAFTVAKEMLRRYEISI